MNRKIFALMCCLLPAPMALALESFTVKDIRVEGLERISAGTLFNYLPIKVGDSITDGSSQQAIRALFKTGFFKDVHLARDGSVLVVTVVERPAIAGIKIEGTTEFKEDDLKTVLKEVGLVEGRVFNRSLLDKIESELRGQYFSRSFYGVAINTTVTPLERNRVDIRIDVIEGNTALIRSIDIVGAEVFDESDLIKKFELEPSKWWAPWSSADKYSKQKLSGDLERLRQHYQDRGYLEFSVDSTQVSIAPDRKNIFVSINVTEGKKYTVRGFRLAGKFPVPEEELRKLVVIKEGDVFARKDVSESTRKISDRLANDGYAFANVNAIPNIDKEKSEVFFTLHVDPGQRVYVRRVNFAGNLATRDAVLRRELRQQEGAWYSADRMQRSRMRLQRLPYIEDVNIETPSVPDAADQVDMNITVKERPSGNLNVGVGYSQAGGVNFTASIREANIFGTGNELSADFDNSTSTTTVNFRYVNPYYTSGGISRGISFSSTSVDTSSLDTASYSSKNLSAGMFFGIPLSEDRSFSVGGNLESTEVAVASNTSRAVRRFVDEYGAANSNLKLTLGWADDSLDSTISPSKGSLQKLSGEFTVPGSDLTYYRLTYIAGRYWPLSDNVSFKLKGELGYGGGYGDTADLPFFKNFYAGGPSSVRGYRGGSLGPTDGDKAVGGDRRVLVNSELLFPLPGTDGTDKSMRMTLFLDGGMVYGTQYDQIPIDPPGSFEERRRRDNLDLGELRYSVGLAFNWFAPVGPITLSYAVPLNDRPGDKTESFQFTIGVPFN